MCLFEHPVLSEGRCAWVLDLGNGRVLKCAKPGLEDILDLESQVLEALQGTAIPVPTYYGLAESGGFRGLEMDRVVGPTLEQVLADDPGSQIEMVDKFVDVHFTIHQTVLPMRRLAAMLKDDLSASGLDEEQQNRHRETLAKTERLPQSLCHYDYHPGNVILTDAGLVVLDWVTGTIGAAVLDVARTLLLCTYPDRTPPEFRPAVNRLHERYADHYDLSENDLHDYLSLVAAARLSEGFEGEEATYLRALATAS